MRYHNITKDDMLNGEGLRVVLWLSGCEHHCPHCQNPITWDENNGLLFDEAAKEEIFTQLEKDYISGLTLSGGDPLHPANREEAAAFAREVRERFPEKTIWLYTGYTWEEMCNWEIVNYIDVIVDGRFIEELKDNTLKWCGSSNQRIIDVPQTLALGNIVLKEKNHVREDYRQGVIQSCIW